MDTFESDMIGASMNSRLAARTNVLKKFHAFAVSPQATDTSADWKQWRCTHLQPRQVANAVTNAAADAPTGFGADAALCYAVASLLVGMASLHKEKTLDQAAKVLTDAHNTRGQLVKAADGELTKACGRIAATHGYAYTPALKRMCAPLAAIYPGTLAEIVDTTLAFATTLVRTDASIADLKESQLSLDSCNAQLGNEAEGTGAAAAVVCGGGGLV